MASAGTQAPESAGYTGTKIPEDRDVVPVSAKPKFWLFQPERHKDPFEIVMDDTATPATIKEEPLDFSDSDGMTFTNNESGDQSINNGDLPF